MWIILLIVLAGILAGYSLRMCAFLKKVNLFVLGLSVGYNPLIVGNLGSFGGQALLLSVAGITGSVLLARVVYLLFFKEGGEK